MKDQRLYLQIYQAIGMRDQSRIERLIKLMREEAGNDLADATDGELRRLARACHGPLLSLEAIEAKERSST